MPDPLPTPPPLPRLSPRPLWRETLDEHEELAEGDQFGNQSIGGWLILFAIGRVLAPLMLAAVLVKDLQTITQPHVWALLTTPGSKAYHPLWSTVLIYEPGGNALLLLFSLVLVCLLFARRKAFPLLMAVYLIVLPLFYLGDHLIGSQIPAISARRSGAEIGSIGGGLLGTLIWVPYLLTSVRVRRTFVK